MPIPSATRDHHPTISSYSRTAIHGLGLEPTVNQADKFGNFGYPFTNTISGNTPERFREALEIAHKRCLPGRAVRGS